jgi:hypothetical protein
VLKFKRPSKDMNERIKKAREYCEDQLAKKAQSEKKSHSEIEDIIVV